MNILFYFASAIDTQKKGQYEQLLEFFKLEREIADYIDTATTPSYKDFTLACMFARAKNILRNLNIID